jgi:hypothetical protein
MTCRPLLWRSQPPAVGPLFVERSVRPGDQFFHGITWFQLSEPHRDRHGLRAFREGLIDERESLRRAPNIQARKDADELVTSVAHHAIVGP